MCFAQRKIRQGRWKMAEVDMEIAALNKQKTVVRVG